MPHLRVVAGTSLDDLHPISVNTGRAHTLSSPLFAGSVVAHIKDFPGPDGKPTESEYFEREDRKGVTWSIQVQGRFMRPVSADDVLFGNTFDRPLHLPWGSSAAFKFMKYVDPTLEHDLTSRTKPWALSPLLSTMPHLAHDRLESEDASMPRFPTKESLTDDVKSLHLAVRERGGSRAPSPASSVSGSSSPSSGSSPSGSTESVVSVPSSVSSHGSASASGSTKSSLKSRLKKGLGRSKEDVNEDGSAPSLAREIERIGSGDAKLRRTFFADTAHRRDVVLGPQDVLTTDFCYGFMAFWPSLALQLPGGLSFDLMKYWDGQPVRFVCCERKGTGGGEGGSGEDEGGDPWGRVFWCVAIELVEDEADVD